MIFHSRFRFPFPGRAALGALAFLLGSWSTAKAADDFDAPSTPPIDLVWHAGALGVFDEEAHDTFASLEGRGRHDWHGLRPWGGFTVADSGAWFAGAGLIYDFRLDDRFRITLGSGPFYYTHDRQSDDLGLGLEFYSFIEARWAWRDDLQFGLRLGHLSNAGLGRRNPGTETLSFVVSAPLEWLIEATH